MLVSIHSGTYRVVHFTVQIDNYESQLVFNLEGLQLEQGCVLSMNKALSRTKL